MRVVEKVLKGVVLLEPAVYGDERGWFYESFNKRTFAELTGSNVEFVQDNHSKSVQGTVRGIHYQLPHPQGKLVRCIEGEIWDVAVDLRKSSPTFEQWSGFTLNEDNRRQLWVPEGFGHGFVVVSPSAQVMYKTTKYWDSSSDRSIRWDDPDLGIAWPVERPLLSRRDSAAPLSRDSVLFD